MALPPGPKSSRLHQTLRWLLRPIPFMEDCRRTYGEAFSVIFVGFKTPMVLVSDPEAVKAIYTERANGMPPGRSIVLEPVMGPRSILLLEGKDHMARRKVMLPPFHGEHMRSYEAVMREAITTEIDSWKVGDTFPIHPRMQSVTLEVILGAVFGVTDPARLARLRALLGQVLSDTASPMLQLAGFATQRFKYGPWAVFQEHVGAVDRELLGLIAERRAEADLESREDILSSLIAAKFEDGDGMTDAEVRDQLMTLLLAGHETTATALAWTFDLLLGNPATLERLVAELAADDGDEYMRATISEGLRLRPVVPIAGRRLSADLSVNGLELPAGTDVAPAMWLTHTRPDVYPDPYAFKPERFLDSPPDTYAWIPFGGGVRRCLGAAFAEFEMRIVLAEVLRRCRLAAGGDGAQHMTRRNITLSPREGTPVTLLSREPAREPVPA
ncbi:MAG: cytochrome family [Solirubrobacterales bacterium]|nr:cytochrome family [Solirubrobacterales bacterium]